MNNVICTSFGEYKKYVEEYYPKSEFSCTKYRKIIMKVFSLIEVTDVFIDYLKDTNYTVYLSQIRHQFLLMLYNLPNYNNFFISSLQRSISESLLRMTIVSVGHEIDNSAKMPFFRIQEKLKVTDEYKLNENKFKNACDSLFSYFGANSKIMHNNPSNKQNSVSYIKGFNVAPNDSESEMITKFLKVISEYILYTFSKNNNINDYTLGLANKIQLKKILGVETYQSYF
ncbi:hypothetical protein M4D71_26015 [Niallia taxi]|uniref:hypothetical protein n=1 Tax=Niallia taxi TaxID=2499688 RepID=UPI0021A6F0C5|nr:hypothetical protein [Niallia taxi]MCT2347606.1 hypothetical protein [Niallia taxi]